MTLVEYGHIKCYLIMPQFFVVADETESVAIAVTLTAALALYTLFVLHTQSGRAVVVCTFAFSPPANTDL